MAVVNQVQKKVKISKWQIVKYQILTHCYLNNIILSNSDLDCLTLLALNQPIELSNFCSDASAEEDSIFKSPQSVRNSLNKSEKHKLIIKDSSNKKLILLNPSLKVQVDGNVLLDYKFFANESKKS